MKECRVPRSLEQVIARIIFLCPSYIDYMAITPEGEFHKFAQLDKGRFDLGRWDQFIGVLEEAVRWNTKVRLVIETIEEESEEGNMHKHHFVLDARRGK